MGRGLRTLKPAFCKRSGPASEYFRDWLAVIPASVQLTNLKGLRPDSMMVYEVTMRNFLYRNPMPIV